MLKVFFCHFSDLDECSLNTHDCNANAICTNTEGSFTCKCDISAHYIGDGKTCTPHRKPNYIFNALCSIRFTTLLIVNFYFVEKVIHQSLCRQRASPRLPADHLDYALVQFCCDHRCLIKLHRYWTTTSFEKRILALIPCK